LRASAVNGVGDGIVLVLIGDSRLEGTNREETKEGGDK